METTFENARMGDHVWDIRKGWGTISNFQPAGKYRIWVHFGNGLIKSYTDRGLFDADDKYQSLFWSEIHIDPPPKPKRKVKKWIKVYQEENGEVYAYRNQPGIGNLELNLWDEKPERHDNDLPPIQIEVEE